MVGTLLDTNVLSELSRDEPDSEVLQNFSLLDSDEIFVSVLTLGEMMNGLSLLPFGRRRDRLEQNFHKLVAEYADRTLNISLEIATIWGSISATAKSNGYHVAPVDGLIAATALHHDLTVLTRNVRDFSFTNVPVLDPWQSGAIS